MRLTADDSSSAEHPTVHARTLEDRPHDPKHARDLQRDLARVPIGQERAGQRADEAAGGHGRRDGTLRVRQGVIKVALVCFCAQDTAHRADVEAEEGTACLEAYVSWLLGVPRGGTKYLWRRRRR